MNQFLCVKDEEGILRPKAGLWRNTEMGRLEAEVYEKNNPEITIARVEIKEI